MEIIQENTSSKISMNSRKIGPNSFFHWHRNYEICQVVKNSCGFFVNGTFIEATEGDIIIIGENVVHKFVPQGKDAYIRILQFSLKVLLDAGIPITILKAHIPAKELDMIPRAGGLVNALFQMIEGEGRVASEDENYFQQSMVCALYCLLARHFTEENRIYNKEQQEFFKILEYINEHFEEDINVKNLSERLFLGRGRLSAIFTKYSAMPPNEYINLLRVKKANNLMNQGCDITEAALQSGFPSIRTFNNIYKKIIGITPSDHKKRSVLKDV